MPSLKMPFHKENILRGVFIFFTTVYALKKHKVFVDLRKNGDELFLGGYFFVNCNRGQCGVEKLFE